MGKQVLMLATVLSLGLLSSVGLAETPVTMNITDDTIWTVGGSPYVIYGANPPLNKRIAVRSGSTLTVDPGVEIRFQPGASLETDSGGSIVAVGSPGDSIVFRSNASEPAAGDWYTVHVFSSPASDFAYCVFEHAEYGLYVRLSAPDLQRCAFRRCEVGVFTYQASPYVGECWFTDSTVRGAWLVHHDSMPIFYHCNLMRNPINMRLDNYAVARQIEAEHNWWGTSDPVEIAEGIIDRDDGHGEGLVDFDPYLTEVPVKLRSWGLIKALFK